MPKGKPNVDWHSDGHQTGYQTCSGDSRYSFPDCNCDGEWTGVQNIPIGNDTPEFAGFRAWNKSTATKGGHPEAGKH